MDEVRTGIMAAGNWIIDHVKLIDTWPNRGMLVNIKQEMQGTGGAPYNVLVDLAKLQADLPLYAVGIVGDDRDGDYIINDLQANRIDISYMCRIGEQPTSYTDVMTEELSGNRTFFHCRGANSLLDVEHFTTIETSAKLFHLGYLLLLDKMDAPDPDYGVRAAKVLEIMHNKGCQTSVDVVSAEGGRFKQVVIPCLPYIDYLIINEIEAGETTGYRIRNDDRCINPENLFKAAESLLKDGVRELVVIHFPEGGLAISSQGEKVFMPSFQVVESEIRGTTGAGDAFCAGMLYGIHEGLALQDTLRIANSCARFNLTNPTGTAGAVSLSKIKEFMKHARLREPVITIEN
jgi:sugar/nucleoside kinase (ribokinase family)